MSKATDPIEFIKDHPKMFLGFELKDLVSPRAVVFKLFDLFVSHIAALNCLPVTIDNVSNTNLIIAETNWLERGCLKNLDTQEIFKKMIPAPEYGANDIRPEIIAYAFSKNIVFIKKGEVSVIKGMVSSETINEILHKYPHSFVLAFEELSV